MSSDEKPARTYPQLSPPQNQPRRPISFVVVHYSDDYLHNILQSECLKNPINELITIDNTSNLYYDNLTDAIVAGISKTSHELIAVVHEDVVLPEYWQSWFEVALDAVEQYDLNWGVLGSVGWTEEGKIVGHWSDPSYHVNSFTHEKFRRVIRIDEQILIFSRARIREWDRDVPSYHHLGRDIPLTVRQQGMGAYAIDAPTIHKYADQNGNLIHTREDSPKIVDRDTLTYKAERACSNEYIMHKWPQLHLADYTQPRLQLPEMDEALRHQLEEPLILLARGGGGSRLLSLLSQDIGVFLGKELNGAGDSTEMVLPIYQGIIEKYRCKARWQQSQIVPRLRAAAAQMLLQQQPPRGPWGFKLPESILLLPEIRMAFPRARYLHMVRDPVTTCLRRTHMTARLDNSIGRISLPLAYDYVKIPRKKILEDSPALHMAYTTIHQLETVANQFTEMSVKRQMQVRFEEIIDNPIDGVERVRSWLGFTQEKNRLKDAIDRERIKKVRVIYPLDVAEKVKNALKSLRRNYGYIPR